MSDQTNIAVMMSVYEAFSRGDIAAVLSHMDSQAELIFEGPSEVPWTGNRHGHDGGGKFFRVVGQNLDDVKSKNMDSPLVHLWTVRNGKVTRCQELTTRRQKRQRVRLEVARARHIPRDPANLLSSFSNLLESSVNRLGPTVP